MVQRTPVIIDTDPGVDDVLAILLALTSPEIEVLAIIVSFGNTDAQSAHLNVLKLYRAIARHIAANPAEAARFPNFAQARKTILAVGEETPLEGEVHNAQYFHGRDGLGDVTQRHPDLNVDKDVSSQHPQLEILTQPGVEVVLDLIRSEAERSITYIVLGPPTTLAKALRVDRDTVNQRLGRVVCMGGNLDVPGNMSPVAEFNFFADPYAVKEVLVPTIPGHGFPLDRFLLLPLDITTPHELRFPTYRERVDPAFESTAVPSRADQKSPLVHFTSAFLERTREVMRDWGNDAVELHDITAVWCAIENPPVPEERAASGIPTLKEGWRAVKRKFDVERTGELTRGMLVVDRRNDVVAYAPGENRAKVQAELKSRHAPHKGEFESTAVPAQVELESKPPPPTPPQERALEGVACITETPGPAVLLEVLLKRVWNA